jgi:hypothetical protein
MTDKHKRLARRATIKIIREVLKSIPFVGLVFKIVFLVMDVTADSEQEPGQCIKLKSNFMSSFTYHAQA